MRYRIEEHIVTVEPRENENGFDLQVRSKMKSLEVFERLRSGWKIFYDL